MLCRLQVYIGEEVTLMAERLYGSLMEEINKKVGARFVHHCKHTMLVVLCNNIPTLHPQRQ